MRVRARDGARVRVKARVAVGVRVRIRVEVRVRVGEALSPMQQWQYQTTQCRYKQL